MSRSIGPQSRFPEPPADVPRTEGGMWFRYPASLIARLSSWTVLPLPNLPKAVVLAAPHSSNWDGLFGVTAAATLGLRMNWMGKSQLFRWPLTPILRASGGVFTDRAQALGAVDQIAQKMREAEKMWLVLAPEGTRKVVRKWRTGFWHIAKKAQVPIVPGFLHYPAKTIGFGPPMFASDDMEADLQQLYAYYAQFKGKNGKIALPLDWLEQQQGANTG